MSDLSTAFSGLVRHQIATPGCALPPANPGITWIWAHGQIFKRGATPAIEVCIPVHDTPIVPGLAPLLPFVHWAAHPRRLPGALLTPLLANAQRAVSNDRIARPIEKQYFYVWRRGAVRLIAPTAQVGTPGSLRYEPPPADEVLCDIHSHHEMPAYFSATDDRDDTGIGVSAVIGRIFTRPTITVRLCCYGHRLRVPATLVFDSLGPFMDAWAMQEVQDANPQY